MKKIMLFLIGFVPATVLAVCNPFVPGQLSASALNNAIASPCITSGTIQGALINNSPIGGATPNTGAFTTLSAASLFTASAVSVTNAISATTISASSVSASSGIIATGQYTTPYTDGIVLDYATGNGRISVGVADTLTFYASGVANTQIGQFSTAAASVPGTFAASAVNATNAISASQYTSTIATGTAPFIVSSTTPVTNLSIGGNAATATTIAGTAAEKLPTITATVATNAMTIGAGAQYLDFRSATLDSGTVTTINAAPSALVIPASATLGTNSGIPNRLMVVELLNAGVAELAVINNANGNPLDESVLITTTTISAGATSANTFYSTTGRTGVPFRVIGYVESTQATAGTWATAPSTIQGAIILPEANLAASTYVSSAVASTSGTSITFTGIPPWVKRITVMFKGVGTSGTSIKQIQLGSGAATTSGYISTGTNFAAGSTASTTVTSGFSLGSNIAADRMSGAVTISMENSSGNSWVASGIFAVTGATTLQCLTGGHIALGGTLDRVIITTINGTDTFAAGEINIMYE